MSSSNYIEKVLGNVNVTPEVLAPGFTVDNVIPYPYGSNVELINGEAVPFLSKLSRASIDAAAAVWNAHPDSKVILLGETCYGNDYPNTTDLMVARGRQQGIDVDAFVPLSQLPDGRPLNNTYTQTEALAHHLKIQTDNAETCLVLGLDYHLRRVARTVHAYRHLGLVKFATVESVLWAKGDHSYDSYLPFTDELHKKDLKLEIVNLLDRRGRILNMAAKLLGMDARMVDITENGQGQLELENTFAVSKLNHLLMQAQNQSGRLPENE